MQKMRLGQAILSGAVALCFYTVPALAAEPADTDYAEEAIEAGSNAPIPEAVVAVTAKTAAGTAAAPAPRRCSRRRSPAEAHMVRT